MANVRLENITRRYQNVTAIENISFKIPDGEFWVLVGPSGCGKSTIMRTIAGLETATSGNLYIGDNLVNNIPARQRDVAMVFQNYALYPHMTVAENLAFGLRMRNVDPTKIQERVETVARSLSIDHLLKRKPKQLSGGQQQRVALGRAIAREPKVFLLDEPLSNLDAQLRDDTRAELKQLHQRLGITTVYVTHDQVEAMTMATRIAVMKDGILQQVGTPGELYGCPGNVFVAGFIGSPAMNFFDATVEGGPEAMYVDTGGFRVEVPPEKRGGLTAYAGRRVIFGIRPENVHDPEFQPAHIRASMVKAHVDVTEMMGNETFLHLVAGKTFLARVDPRTGARPCQEMDVAFDMDRMHAFDPETERISPTARPFELSSVCCTPYFLMFPLHMVPCFGLKKAR